MENRKRDMLDAEAAYCAMEEDLQEIIDFIEITYPDYDHYEYDLDEIGHDPYVLISMLSALHGGEFTLKSVCGQPHVPGACPLGRGRSPSVSAKTNRQSIP